MKKLNSNALMNIEGGSDTADTICGLAIGGVVVGTAVFGFTGFLLTINKALAACGVAAAT